MSIDKNIKLGAVLSKVMTKTASLGKFKDIDKTHIALIEKILNTKQYQGLISELRDASGVINLVTRSENPALIEYLIKESFPPSSNASYHMGHEDLISDEYYVDASKYFGVRRGAPGELEAAKNRMIDLIVGSNKIPDIQYYLDMELSENDVNSSIEPFPVIKRASEAGRTGRTELDIPENFRQIRRGTNRIGNDTVVWKNATDVMRQYENEMEILNSSHPQSAPSGWNPSTDGVWQDPSLPYREIKKYTSLIEDAKDIEFHKAYLKKYLNDIKSVISSREEKSAQEINSTVEKLMMSIYRHVHDMFQNNALSDEAININEDIEESNDNSVRNDVVRLKRYFTMTGPNTLIVKPDMLNQIVSKGTGILERVIGGICDVEMFASIQNFRKKLKYWQGVYLKYKNVIKNRRIYQELARRMSEIDTFGTSSTRNQDGFSDWDPSKSLRDIYFGTTTVKRENVYGEDDLLSESEPPTSLKKDGSLLSLVPEGRQDAAYRQMMRDFASQISLFKSRLKEYRTTNKEMLSLKNDILSMLSGETSLMIENLKANWSSFDSRVLQFLDKASSNGNVMIFDNFESTPFCEPASPRATGVSHPRFVGGEILERMKDSIASSRLISGMPSHKSILIITSVPVEGLSDYVDVSVDMDNHPVDPESAKIIVNEMMSPYISKKIDATIRGFRIDIEKQLNNMRLTGDEKNKKRDSLLMKVIAYKSKIESDSNFGKIESQFETQLLQGITGMSVDKAIEIMETSLRKNASEIKDDYDNLVDIQIDSASLCKNVVDKANELSSRGGSSAIRIREPNVEYHQYIYAKTNENGEPTTWAGVVGKVGAVVSNNLETRTIINKNVAIRTKLEQTLTQGRRSRPQMPEREQKDILDKIASINELIKLHEDEFRNTREAAFPPLTCLHGDPGVGKSVWADALASAFSTANAPFYIRDVDLGSLFDKWVGGTEQNTRRFIDTLRKARHTVFLIDEIDRQLEQGGQGSSGQQRAHETTKRVVSSLLDVFEREQKSFVEREVYLVLTTNHKDLVDRAMGSRTTWYEVLPPNDPADYEKFMRDSIDVMKKRNYGRPLVTGGKTSLEEQWEATKKLVDGINLRPAAEIMCKKKLNLRLSGFLIEYAIRAHILWEQYLSNLKNGRKNATPMGFPLTQQNLIRCASLTEQMVDQTAENIIGVDAVMNTRVEKIKQMMDEKGEDAFISEEASHPIDPDDPELKFTSYSLPEDILKEAYGDNDPNVEEEDFGQYTYDTGAYGDTPSFIRTEKPSTVDEKSKEMEGLVEKGLSPLEEDEEKIDLEKKTKPKDTDKEEEFNEKIDKDTVKSSTDYLYNYLMKQGFFSGDKPVEVMPETKAGISPQPLSAQPRAVQQGVSRRPYTHKDFEAQGIYHYPHVVIIPAEIINRAVRK